MFGFSIPKLLVLAAIIGAVWYGFKFVSRRDEARRADDKLGSGGKGAGGLAGQFRQWAARRRGGSKAGGEGRAPAEDMVQCTVCGAYVAAHGATSCGRDDCPYTA